jgi:PAS domain S-box-containing protein
MSTEEALAAAHELAVHQIELEMQNQELRRTQSALEASRAEYFELYDLVPVGYCTLDETGTVVRANLCLASLLGVTRQNIVGRRLTSFVHHEDQDAFYLLSRYLNVTQSGPRSQELRLLRQDGTTSWVNLSMGLLPGEQGKQLRSLAFSDITSQKAAEANLRHIQLVAKAVSDRAESLAEIARRTTNAVFIVDLKGLLDWVNEGFSRLTGVALDQAIGRRPSDILNCATADAGIALLMERAIKSMSPVQGEIVCRSGGGTEATLLMEIAPLRSESGSVKGFMAIGKDISTRRAVELELSAATTRAEAANRAKSEFLANMSHEIRTPLTAILGFAELLEDGKAHDDGMQDGERPIDIIRNAGSHLLTVINDILDLSKIEAEMLTVECIDTPLTKLLRDVEHLLRPKAVGKGIGLAVRLRCPVPDRILSDPTRLRQILMNLLGNAVKFTESGSVAMVAGVETVGTAPTLVIDIEDTGPGMSSEQTTRMFQPFSQADTSVTRNYGGAGLGLVISRRLANKLGGDVTLLRTQPGIGSYFRLTLPLNVPSGSVSVTRLEADPVHPARDNNSAGVRLHGRVLLAEDGVDNQRLIAHHLRKAGAEVEIASNGCAALAMIDDAVASGKPFDLLVTDIQMPEMDGYALARTLRERGSILAIIALTAHAMAEDREKCLAAGCDDYSSKPIDSAGLILKCNEWVGKQSHTKSATR